jgi:transcriptional regulator with XRE-family HTH domain
VPKLGVTGDRARLAKLLRELRTDAGLRQVDLAERLGEPQSYVSKYESGEQRLDLLELRAVCRAVGASLVQLVERFEGEA